LAIQTRSPIAVRDIDLFRRFKRIRVNMTIATDSDTIRKRYEPRCASIDQRFKAIRAIAEAGIAIGVSISPTLPILNPELFGVRLAELDAAEYVTQYMKRQSSRFRAGSTIEAMCKMNEDGWTPERYLEARKVIQWRLGDRPLLEGTAGYAPP
jgi:DNA repair photolyase